jgi:hypothetical protein
MAFYRLKIGFRVGSGTITINGVEPEQFYEEGDGLTIAVTLDAGYNSVEWFRAGTSIATTTSFLFVMPSRDVSIAADASGAFTPISDYGLKYTQSFKQNFPDGKCIGLEIYQFGFGGDSSPIGVESIKYYFGNLGDDPVRPLIGSKVDFILAGTINEFEEFLTGDNRTWKVVVKEDSDIFFEGFLSIDFLTTKDMSGPRLQKFTATDGFNSFSATRANSFIYPGVTRDKGISAIIGALNQSFKDFRPVNIICNFFEYRMDPTTGIFEQFFTPDAVLWNDGERVRFTDEAGRIENDQLYISEVLTRLLNPFLCRCFLYDNEFWIVRVPEMRENDMTGIKYLPDVTIDGAVNVDNDFEIDCIINEPERTSRRVFTDFTAKLKLGVLFDETKGAVYEAKFSSEEWFVQPQTGPYPGRFTLLYWDYVNARPSNQPSSVPTGDEALIQFASDALKIWTTSTSAGIADTNVSYVALSTESTGRRLVIAEEIANKIGLSFKYMMQDISDKDPANTVSAHNIGFMLRIGGSYLRRVGPTGFDWVTSENVCQFTALNVNAYNTIEIPNLDVPETGEVEFRFYQLLINSNVTRHKYAINFDDLKINIEQNESLQLNEISTKAVTDSPYSYIYPDYETFIGDTITNLNASAIRLDITDTPVSELWSRDGVEQEPLLDLIAVELANLFGVRNRRIIGTIERAKPRPYQSIRYNGSLWMVIAIEWDAFRDRWRVELFELGPIPST